MKCPLKRLLRAPRSVKWQVNCPWALQRNCHKTPHFTILQSLEIKWAKQPAERFTLSFQVATDDRDSKGNRRALISHHKSKQYHACHVTSICAAASAGAPGHRTMRVASERRRAPRSPTCNSSFATLHWALRHCSPLLIGMRPILRLIMTLPSSSSLEVSALLSALFLARIQSF